MIKFIKKTSKERVSWENVCKTKEEGGLGIKEVPTFKGALLGMWIWKFMNEEYIIGGGCGNILQYRYRILKKIVWYNIR